MFPDGVKEVQYEGADETKAIRALHNTIPVVDPGERVELAMYVYAP